MILFPEDIQAINDLLGQRADLDRELLETCQEHIQNGQYADAVFKAFLVLETRIRQRSGIRTKTRGAADLIGQALASTPEGTPGKVGPLTRKLDLDHGQAVNLANLLRAAFAVFRNPEGHGGVEPLVYYGSAECQAVLGFVNLMLGVLDRQADAPLDRALKQLRRTIGAGATQRLSDFLDRVLALNVSLVERKTMLSFRAPAWRATSEDTPPSARLTNLFSLHHEDEDPYLHFPLFYQWRPIVGFDAEAYAARLVAGDCERWPGGVDPWLDLSKHNSTATFNWLYGIVQDISAAMRTTVDSHTQS